MSYKIIYESGFGDRVISLRLASTLRGTPIKSKRQFQRAVETNKDILKESLAEFPRIFVDRISGLCR